MKVSLVEQFCWILETGVENKGFDLENQLVFCLSLYFFTLSGHVDLQYTYSIWLLWMDIQYRLLLKGKGGCFLPGSMSNFY